MVQLTVFVPLAKELPDGGAQVTGTAPQLSVAVAVNVATASHRSVAVFRVRSAGHEMTGRSTSVTTTENMQLWTLPDASSATQKTEVSPIGNGEPDSGEQIVCTPGQLSVAETLKVTTAEHCPGGVFVVSANGQDNCGNSESWITTLNAQLTELLLLSVAKQFTTVDPTEKMLPGGGTHCTVAPGQFSLMVFVYWTMALHRPGSVLADKSDGQVSTGR